MQGTYKETHEFHKRVVEAQRVKSTYNDRIPVIIEKSLDCKLETLKKSKFLVPSELSVGQFVYVIRKNIKLSPEQAIFIFVNNVLPPTASLMSDIYAEHHDADGFLYFTYAGENTFG